jgi:hypothetical protein
MGGAGQISPGDGGAPVRQSATVPWLFEETVRCYRRHFVGMTGILVVAILGLMAVSYYSNALATDILEEADLSDNVWEILERPPSEVISTGLNLLAVGIGTLVVISMILLLLYATAIRYVYDGLLDRSTTVLESFTKILPTIPWLLAAGIVMGLIVSLGLLLLVIPGIYFFLMFILVPHAAILDGMGPIGALSRSSQLTSGNKLSIFLFFAFWGILLTLAYIVLLLLDQGPWFQVAEAFVLVVVAPISTTLVYHRASSQQG